jgi:Protein of Unknown function (DUF2784)
MWYRVAVDAVVVVHFLFICFVVAGVFLAWRWPRVIWLHIPAILYAIAIELIGFACPLTALENFLRHRAGEAGYSNGFIYHYLIRVIYPPGLTRPMQVGLGFLVALVAAVGYRGYLRRHPPRWSWWPGHRADPPQAGPPAVGVPAESEPNRQPSGSSSAT